MSRYTNVRIIIIIIIINYLVTAFHELVITSGELKLSSCNSSYPLSD